MRFAVDSKSHGNQSRRSAISFWLTLRAATPSKAVAGRRYYAQGVTRLTQIGEVLMKWHKQLLLREVWFVVTKAAGRLTGTAHQVPIARGDCGHCRGRAPLLDSVEQFEC